MKHQIVIESLKAFDKEVKERSLKVYSEDYIKEQSKVTQPVTVITKE